MTIFSPLLFLLVAKMGFHSSVIGGNGQRLCSKYDIDSVHAKFYRVIKAIFDPVKLLVQKMEKQSCAINLPMLQINRPNFLAEGNSNK